ncbi:hypothetical protein LTR36_002955 [Oleoguttula mirabilis]|uniref:F-box domain-containing protein n=1 Tax=Oleoguttula mirabilis TaxID=1507867 RepID=A0AAV9JWI7_9PEZI|nr:hypothetical protein LTR36_002955 [Oleoguttula mirabilis]
MTTLPDDVMLVVLSHTDIDTFLERRLLNRKLHALIKTHIHGLTKAVAQGAFPKQTRILLNGGDSRDPAHAGASLRWLKALRYQQLAAILLERRSLHAISAEDPLGDDLIHQLALGWRVLQRFAEISREVDACPSRDLPLRDLKRSQLAPTERDTAIEIACLRELEICARRIVYVETLPAQALKAYKSLRHRELLKEIFGSPRTPSPAHDDADVKNDHEFIANPWVFSQVAKSGAEVFWRSWWGKVTGSPEDVDSSKLDIEAAWRRKEPLLKTYEAQGILCIDRQLNRIMAHLRRRYKSSHDPPILQSTMLSDNFEPLLVARERQRLTEAGELAPDFVLTGVRIEQTLDWEAFGAKPNVHIRVVDEEARRQRRRASGFLVKQPVLLPGYEELLTEWDEGWVQRRN